uniref:Uncharacterized protein n=1 Tax=Siphoviridae sp. ct0eR1 TaxID=2825297 RepID=A0A8S5UH92_9CAUD|nr:MAG TPA: hypothetical protein [Siphoviridae sp. ct0eR1]
MFYERQRSGDLVIVGGLTLTGGVTASGRAGASVIRSQRQSQSTNNLGNSIGILRRLIRGNNIESSENTENGGEQSVQGLADLGSKHVYESPHRFRNLRLSRD